MTDRALEHLRNAKGRQRKAFANEVATAMADWLDGECDDKPTLHRIARAMHDCGIDPKKTARMREQEVEVTS